MSMRPSIIRKDYLVSFLLGFSAGLGYRIDVVFVFRVWLHSLFRTPIKWLRISWGFCRLISGGSRGGKCCFWGSDVFGNCCWEDGLGFNNPNLAVCVRIRALFRRFCFVVCSHSIRTSSLCLKIRSKPERLCINDVVHRKRVRNGARNNSLCCGGIFISHVSIRGVRLLLHDKILPRTFSPGRTYHLR